MSLPYRLGSNSLFVRPNENSILPKRVVFLSVEGTKTEVNYFKLVEKYREELGIDAVVHIEVLRKHDTNSDLDSVLELLEEYVEFRKNDMFQDEIPLLNLKNYTEEFIRNYLDDPNSLPLKQRHKFEALLKEEHIDLLYLDFLSKYHGEDDLFGIVIDRDCGSHSVNQMHYIVSKCKEKNYNYYISNPCIEFWLLLHVSDISVEYSALLEDILKNQVDEHENTFISNLLYEKTGQRKAIQAKCFEKYYLPNLDLAIDRSKEFASGDALLTSIGSNLGDLFVTLRES